MKVIEDLTGTTAEGVALWARDRRGRLELAASAVHAAYEAAGRHKIRALGLAVADGMSDDARLDYDQLLVKALAQVDESHIRVLRAMVLDSPPPPGRAGEMSEGTWCRTQLEAHLPGLAGGIGAIAAVLVSVGMIAEGGVAAEPDEQGVNLSWAILPFGTDCLRLLMTGPDVE